MVDVVSPAVRSRMMSSIRSRDTKPEMQVRSYLHSRGFRFRIGRKDLPGKPDVVLTRWNVAIFVHGCFWHGHESCRYAAVSKTRPEFWRTKIASNSARDALAAEALLSLGWRVTVIWECALRHKPAEALLRLEEAIRSESKCTEIRLDLAGEVGVDN